MRRLISSISSSTGPTKKYRCSLIRPRPTCIYPRQSQTQHVGGILSVHQQVPITVRGRTLPIEQRIVHTGCPLVLWRTPQSLGNDLIRGLLVLNSKGSHGRCPGLEVYTTYRRCSGSVSCLHISPGQLSRISRADLAVLTPVHVRDCVSTVYTQSFPPITVHVWSLS